MSSTRTMYSSSTITDLRERTEYEVWLLEAMYEIVDQRLAADGIDELAYPPTGGPPNQTIYGIHGIDMRDWRPGFLRVGAPLVFVTAFKLLDMVFEWILAQNGIASTHRFEQKIAALTQVKSRVQFPPMIETRPWLRDRLVGLYERLEPFRGTIIHSRHLKGYDGELRVSSSKRGVVGPLITISATDLRNIAFTTILLVKHIDGTLAMDLFREKCVRRALDELSHLHGLTCLGQLPPRFLTVRVYVLDEDPIEWDINKIQQDVTAGRPPQDVVFDIRIVAVSRDGTRVSTYLIPWDRIESLMPSKTRSDLQPFVVTPPDGLDLRAIARDLQLRANPA